MNNFTGSVPSQSLATYDRNSRSPDSVIQIIGSGAVGGKAQGLVFLDHLLSTSENISKSPQIQVRIPNLIVLCTDIFDAFLEKNNLARYIDSDHSDDQIAHAFQNAELPFFILGDLQAIVEQIKTPIAVRSSSLLEDATYEPFAGIYSTKMIPNHQYDPHLQFQKLSEAIKFVYASTYFKAAKSYRNATGNKQTDEKMAVILQKVHGRRHHVRFYPELSGVGRSYNYYPIGRAKPDDGVINLALGLGKTIVDGGLVWSYSPRYPKIGPPFGSTDDLLKNSQKEFWAINMGTPLVYDPIKETEYLVKEDLRTAEKDGTLKHLCSTYDPQSDRLQIGMSIPGPRALTFSPILHLKDIPLNETVLDILGTCQEKLDSPVEIEFAMTFSPHSLGLLQVRPMVVSSSNVQVTDEDLNNKNTLAASENSLGNGVVENITDVVYVIPDQFELEGTRKISEQLAMINHHLLQEQRPYLLIVFGRLGSSDPWLGIPVNWGQISGTKVIIETYLEDFSVDMSQGSHFFHNLTSLGVSYLSIPKSGKYKIDWEWLEEQQEIQKTHYVRHVKLKSPLYIKVDGRSSRGSVLKTRGNHD
jgi:hypothetical protein